MVCITLGARMAAPLKATVWFGGAIVRGAAALEVCTSTRLCAGLSLAQAFFMSAEQAGCVKRGHGCVRWMCLEDTATLFAVEHFLQKVLWRQLYNSGSRMASDFSALYIRSIRAWEFQPKTPSTYTSVSVTTYLNGLASCSPQGGF